ncbi:Rpn family recombination-promoting nuclease/putative transposase [Amphibacillus cookii]|uniref:Rpn family recombination-promoting nuclease/putative transposase n=1 Tax=Amphibacillus cookii TaxID=767787 RepID=UPI001958BE70|nr:Rpn family recombination-promoting nuclease/putative transposase [Amphibacillus cookii]MBM7542316.1 putative transposase/invertase (TIGR01784 family) [Amphibacillus cookii]
MNNLLDRDVPIHVLFEQLFCQEQPMQHQLLISFINAALEEGWSDGVEEIVYTQQEQQNGVLKDYQICLTVKARTLQKKHLDLKIQVRHQDFYDKQSLYEWGPPYLNPLSLEKNDPFIRQSFIINILNFNLLQESSAYHNLYQVTHQHESDQYIPNINIHYFELPKLLSSTPKKMIEKWLLLFKYLGKKQKPSFWLPLIKEDRLFKYASDTIESFMLEPLSADHRCWYVKKAKQEQALLIQGIESGQRLEKERLALKMIKTGYQYQRIIDVTGLTEQALDELALKQYSKIIR